MVNRPKKISQPLKNTKFFVISLDVEGDNEWEEKKRQHITLENINQIPRFHRLCQKFNIRPTYLLSYPAIVSNKSAGLFRELNENGDCEIGTHLHVWSTPPIRTIDIKNMTFQMDLSIKDLKEKLKKITDVVHSSVHCEPVSFRAGRWGIDGRSLRLLEELDYLIDSSVTPSFSWEKIGGPKFITASPEPYHPDCYDLTKMGNSTILEIPVSIAFSIEIPIFIKKIYFKLSASTKGILKRLNIIHPIWLEPTFTPFNRLLNLSLKLMRRGSRFLHMMLHSSSLLSGGSPMSANSKRVEKIFFNLENYFYFLKENFYQPVTFIEYRNQRIHHE